MSIAAIVRPVAVARRSSPSSSHLDPGGVVDRAKARRPAPRALASLVPALVAVATFLLAAPRPAHAADPDPTDAAPASRVFLGGTIYPVTAPPIADGFLRIADGRIVEVGPRAAYAPRAGEAVHDLAGRALLPGLIDTHSHMGVYAWPSVAPNWDGNEMVAPVTAHVRAEDAINLEDTGFFRALAGGITTIQVLPGSGNLIGGETVVLKLRLGGLLADMKMADAPRGIKMAMGENPKRVYGGRGEMPGTRMGNVAKLREVFLAAQEYAAKRDRHAAEVARHAERLARWEASDDRDEKDPPAPPTPPERHLLHETLADVLAGRVRVNVHCYRKDDFHDFLRVADEFGFRPHSFHHALEAYKIADELAARGIAICTWPDWWGFKHESFDAVPENMAIAHAAGVVVALHSDSHVLVQRFLFEAAKAVHYGMTRDDALATITINPAKVLGIDHRVGSLEPGKDADFCLVEGDPFDVYALVVETWIDGVRRFDRAADGDLF